MLLARLSESLVEAHTGFYCALDASHGSFTRSWKQYHNDMTVVLLDPHRSLKRALQTKYQVLHLMDLEASRAVSTPRALPLNSLTPIVPCARYPTDGAS